MRSKRSVLLFCILSGLLFSCNPDKISVERNNEGAVTKMPFHWRKPISNGPQGSDLYRGYTIPGKGILYIGRKKGADPIFDEVYLGLKDFATGSDIWIWDGFFEKKVKTSLHDNILLENNKILIHDLNAHYLVNAENGAEIWKQQRFSSVSPVTGLDGSFFISALSRDHATTKKEEDVIFEGNLQNGALIPLVKPNYSEEFAKLRDNYLQVGYLWRQTAFHFGGEIMLIIPYVELGPPARYVDNRAFWGLYNVTQKKWVYDRIPLSFPEDGGASSVTPIVDGDKVYLTSLATVGCYELKTGKRIWQKRLTDVNTGVFDMLLAEGRLLINVHNAVLHCLDARTGAPYWTQKSSGISSDLYYQDGVVYWIPSKNLRAVDIRSGKLLWDLPTMDKEADSHWWGFVTGIPGKNGEKGKIFATSDLYMYSFDAAK